MSSEIYWREEKQMGNFIFVFPEVNMQHIHRRNKTICTICGDLCILFFFPLHVHIKLVRTKRTNLSQGEV